MESASLQIREVFATGQAQGSPAHDYESCAERVKQRTVDRLSEKLRMNRTLRKLRLSDPPRGNIETKKSHMRSRQRKNLPAGDRNKYTHIVIVVGSPFHSGSTNKCAVHKQPNSSLKALKRFKTIRIESRAARNLISASQQRSWVSAYEVPAFPSRGRNFTL